MTDSQASTRLGPLLQTALNGQGGQVALRRRISEAVSRQMPSVRLAATDGCVQDLDLLLPSIRQADDPGVPGRSAMSDHFRAIGAFQARKGRPLVDLLLAYRIRRQVIVDYVREAGALVGSSAGEVLGTVDAVLSSSSTLCAQVAFGYDAAERHKDAAHRQRTAFIRALLGGTLDTADLLTSAAMHAIDAEQDYFAMRARPAPGHGVDELARAHGLDLDLDLSNGAGLATVVDSDLVGFVCSPPERTFAGVSGIGPARPLRLMHESFRMASRALHAADSRQLSGAQEFGRLGLLPAVLGDEAIGAALCRRYLTPLGDTEFATEIIRTLRAYLRHGMHVPRTADVLFVHPNTVRYRIGKFEALTGVSLRANRIAAFEVLWALEHRAGAVTAPTPPPGSSQRPRQ